MESFYDNFISVRGMFEKYFKKVCGVSIWVDGGF